MRGCLMKKILLVVALYGSAVLADAGILPVVVKDGQINVVLTRQSKKTGFLSSSDVLTEIGGISKKGEKPCETIKRRLEAELGLTMTSCPLGKYLSEGVSGSYKTSDDKQYRLLLYLVPSAINVETIPLPKGSPIKERVLVSLSKLIDVIRKNDKTIQIGSTKYVLFEPLRLLLKLNIKELEALQEKARKEYMPTVAESIQKCLAE